MDKNKFKCPICNKSLKNIFLNLCRDCHPAKYKKRYYPHQRLRRTKRWKKRREKLLEQQDYTCQMCNKKFEKDLVITHVEDELHSGIYLGIWDDLYIKKMRGYFRREQEYIDEFLDYHLKKNVKESVSYFKTKNREKFERTIKFLEEFLKNPAKFEKKWNKTIRRDFEFAQLDFEKRVLPLFYDELVEKYKQEVKDIVEKYLNTEEVLVLCRRCHYAFEKGMKLCHICKENYHYPKYDYCYNCRTENMIFCPYCGKFFNQIESKTCPDCNKLYFQDNELIQSIFRFTPAELKWQEMEGDYCLLCKGSLDYERLPNYFNLIFSRNKISCIGFLCDDCASEVQNSYNPEYEENIQIRITNDPI